METTAVRASPSGIGPDALEAAILDGATATGGAARSSAPRGARRADATTGASPAGAGRATATRGAAARTKVVTRGPGAIAGAASGYAEAAKKTTPTKTTKTTTTKASTSASAKSLEDKLFEFLKDYVARVEKQMDEAIEGKKAAASSTRSGARSLLDVVTDAVPVLGQLESFIGKGTTRSLLGSLGAGILGGLASVIGTPALGAIVTQVAPTIIDAALGAHTGSSTAAAADRSGTSTGNSEQLQVMEIQRLQAQLQRMFETVSNVLKSRHDMLMSAVHNLR